jgi:hypothetical protein
MEQIKKQITDLLWSHVTKVNKAGSCGELGDSFMAIDADTVVLFKLKKGWRV